MNPRQRRLLAIYLPWTLLILLLARFLPGTLPTALVKYAATLTLALTVWMRPPKEPRRRKMARAFLFAAAGDLFLVLLGGRGPWGVAGATLFLLAYLNLLQAWNLRKKPGPGEAATALPFLTLAGAATLLLAPHVSSLLLLGGLPASLILAGMAWTGVRQLFGSPFPPRTARFLAAASTLMFLCDLGVALGLHPALAGQPWMEQLVWTAYLPGWTLLALALEEDA